VHRAVTIVGIEIVARKLRQGAAAIDVAARDRTGGVQVGILDHRLDADRGAGIGGIAVRPFHNIPAEVVAAAAPHRGGRDIHFLVAILPHVPDVEVAGLPVE